MPDDSHLRDPRHLDDLLNYRLMKLQALSGGPVVRMCEGGHGISRREWRIVALLAAHGELSPSELADRGQLDRARTSRAIGTLVTKRLVLRLAQPGDRRRAQVALTDDGRALYDRLFPRVAEVNRQVLSVLDDAALAAFDRALAALTQQAGQVNRDLALDVRADRRHGGSRRHWREDGSAAGEGTPAPGPHNAG